jgi:hypothetical protein
MMNPNMTTLIVIPQLVGSELAKLDAKNATHRAAVLDAVEALIVDYVVPAMNLAQTSETGEVIFDLKVVANCELSGLIRGGFFDPKFPDLKKPDDHVLNEALEFIGVETSSPEQRDAFFSCWAADMASLSAGSMLAFLRSTFPQSTDNAVNEANRLEKLLKTPLTSSLEYQISTLVEHIRQFASASDRSA